MIFKSYQKVDILRRVLLMLTRAHSGTFLGKIGADFSSFRIRLAIIPQRSTRIIIRGLSNFVATLTTTSRPARFPPERSKRSSIWPQLLNRPSPNRSGSVLSRFHSSDLLSRASEDESCFSSQTDLQRFNCNAGSDTVNPSNAYVEGCINGTRIYLQQHAAVMGGAGIAVACLMVRMQFAFLWNSLVKSKWSLGAIKSKQELEQIFPLRST